MKKESKSDPVLSAFGAILDGCAGVAKATADVVLGSGKKTTDLKDYDIKLTKKK